MLKNILYLYSNNDHEYNEKLGKEFSIYQGRKDSILFNSGGSANVSVSAVPCTSGNTRRHHTCVCV